MRHGALLLCICFCNADNAVTYTILFNQLLSPQNVQFMHKYPFIDQHCPRRQRRRRQPPV